MNDPFAYLTQGRIAEHEHTPPEATVGTPDFARFHQHNPHIYDGLRRLALDARRCGVRKLGIQLLIEKMRYDHAITTRGEDLKINNNYSAAYARMLMKNNTELVGFFETRKAKIDE